MLQLLVVNVSVVEAAGAPPPEDTCPSPASSLDTSTVAAAVGSLASATVKVAAPPSATVNHGSFASAGSAGLSTSPASSSSVIRRFRAAGFPIPLETPDTTTRLPATVGSTIESTSSSTAVIVTVPVLAVEPAAMISVFAALSVKSSAAAFVPGTADTVTVAASLSATVRCAVTVAARVPAAAPASSSIMLRDSARNMSVDLPVASADAAPSGAPIRVAITRTV